MMNTTETEGNPSTNEDGRLLLTVGHVARTLSLSIRTVWRLTSTGELPRPVSIGRAKRWERAAIEAYVKAKCGGQRTMRDGV